MVLSVEIKFKFCMRFIKLLFAFLFRNLIFLLSFCLFSECRSYRWILKRELLSGKKTVVFIGLNPSKANSSNNDRTLVRIINFCSRWNYKNIYIINLFGLISKSPSLLSKSLDPVGNHNNLITLKVLEFWSENINCDLWLGWGDKGQLNGRDLKVLEIIKNLSNFKSNENYSKRILSLGLSKKGNPLHPLYMPNESFLRPFGQ